MIGSNENVLWLMNEQTMVHQEMKHYSELKRNELSSCEKKEED